ncbi:hypothetical protein SEVIR_5G244400v4 [Setaria viridis]|uniref:Uncharacterized protein n=1 Tax=Setaria viridis TaxID=4556 RepID=A0A4V6D9Z4_SETVI|nr:uncharacterized protein LOC117857937 [Setaria viridis]TKW15546.1 hypothetical protein SEVIR_5G244400v2 [Setaria viridis]
MAGVSKSKVREWMRKRMAPRRKAAKGGGGGSSDDRSASASAPSSPGRKLLAGAALPSALRWRKPRGNVLAALFQRVAYHLLWFVESVVVVAQLVFFFVRFGFKL